MPQRAIARRSWFWPCAGSMLLLYGVVAHLASPVRDAVTEQPAAGFHLSVGWRYLMLAPWCSIADQLTLLSLHELYVFLVYALVACLFIPRRMRHRFLAVVTFLLFIAWAVLCPRPASRLVAENSDVLLIDLHSHTSFSHDGRISFTPERNMRWHERQGFNAAFITDHNQAAGAEQAAAVSAQDWTRTGYRSLRGDEASLFQTHLCVFAPHERIDNVPFDSDPAKIAPFVSAMHAQGYLVTANLPEYWRFHWQRGQADFWGWDVDGFEIVNSAPRALDFPPWAKRGVIDFCRTHNLFVDGVSDNHGWGSATTVWDAMTIPGWRQMDPGQLETAVLADLRTERFHAVQVLERYKYFPENRVQLLVSPIATLFVWARSLTLPAACSCLVWIWILALLRPRPDERRYRPQGRPFTPRYL